MERAGVYVCERQGAKEPSLTWSRGPHHYRDTSPPNSHRKNHSHINFYVEAFRSEQNF